MKLIRNHPRLINHLLITLAINHIIRRLHLIGLALNSHMKDRMEIKGCPNRTISPKIFLLYIPLATIRNLLEPDYPTI